MLDHENPDAARASGRGDARERHQARTDAVNRVAPRIRALLDARTADSDAVRTLWDAWQVDSQAAAVWREMYYALQATLESAAA
jgi:hypothetical protein